MKYRKKPVVIEAFQYDGDIVNINAPDWAIEAINSGTMFYDAEDSDSPPCELFIST